MIGSNARGRGLGDVGNVLRRVPASFLSDHDAGEIGVSLDLSALKEELHTRILKNLKEREKYSLQNSAKIMKIG